MCNNCKCKQEIKLEEVETDYGIQLMFGFDDKVENNQSGLLDEIERDIKTLFKQDRLILPLSYGSEELALCNRLNKIYEEFVLGIINKYRGK